MIKFSVIGLLLCLILVMASAGCVDSNPSARAADNQQSTIEEVIKLLEGDIDEEIILAYIQKHEPPQNLSADEIVALKSAGASKAILSALLNMEGKHTGSEFPFQLTEDHTVGAPIEHGALAVYPIYLEASANAEEFITLDEAEESGVIIITEKSNGSVPCVLIENTGEITIYICAGEVILGGRQDRMIAHDVVVAPGETIEVKVRCVEHGRWQGSSIQFSSSGFMGSNKVREAVQFMAQSDVWDRVAEQNAQLEAQTSTGTYRSALTHQEIQELYEEFASEILPKLEGDNLVGMIIAVNGEVLCIDIFGSPDLFDDLKAKILKASVLDMIGVEDNGALPPSKEQIVDFYRQATQAESEELQGYQHNTNNKRDSENAQVNESMNKDNQEQIYHQNIIQKQK